eukprot:TRINITY_DN15000_c0_g1_i1.p1 TRINITY_DN15000_c0_g1~~TRINITY_DN15000_c0_g1_i1.p1  ORF type:complete len:326 (+),score=64.96 TRINITY_DN15000_c0_g1_i1:108-980(+)
MKNRIEIIKMTNVYIPAVISAPIQLYCNDRSAEFLRDFRKNDPKTKNLLVGEISKDENSPNFLGNFMRIYSSSYIWTPNVAALLSDCGKLRTLDNLLTKLKQEGHRVLLYCQMTKMIDILEDFMWYRSHKYVRLDGSSKLTDRRDMVDDFQTKDDIFVFLLSTRAGGMGINLTAADTVIFYESDWNPTMDEQAMDRAHRLGQKRQVTVYRLITKGTIEERILLRAKQKHHIQSLVISGGNYNAEQEASSQDMVSWLLDDESLEKLKQVDSMPTKKTAKTRKQKKFNPKKF